jgi:hypothetical protein
LLGLGRTETKGQRETEEQLEKEERNEVINRELKRKMD